MEKVFVSGSWRLAYIGAHDQDGTHLSAFWERKKPCLQDYNIIWMISPKNYSNNKLCLILLHRTE